MTTVRTLGNLTPADEPVECYPALRQRKHQLLDSRFDKARRELWRAFQRGALSEEEFACTLERIDSR